MSIQRYVGIEVHEDADGDMIAYEDHIAAIEHLERVHRNEINELRWMNGVTRDDSFAAGVQSARDAVASADCWYATSAAVQVAGSDVKYVVQADALAAIDALRGDA